jgi:two-component system sensor histidine kinase/response regulator
LNQTAYDIILLDLSLPDGQGMETFNKMKISAQNVPIVVLSGLDDETITVKAMQQGAQDYLLKGDIDAELLTRAIRHAIERQHLLTEQLQAKNQLTRQAIELQNRNAELDQFAHTVAHQVQGLLGQIIGYGSFMEMTQKEKLDNEGRLALKHILQSGHKMNNVLSEILLLASVGREEVEMIPLDMKRVVAEARKRLIFEINEHDAQINQIEFWPTAVGYPSWIEEVWVNYISNGLKYGGSPPVLELGAMVSEDHTVCFWVKDNGSGISEADQLRLFKTHTRLNPQRTRGEGLGLSIVRRIVEKCGGEVGVNSQLGEGSTFWFTLPQA